jgi:hypothetical protein
MLSWALRMENGEASREEHSTYDKIRADWIGRIWLWSCLLKRVTISEVKTAGNIEGTRKEEEYVSSYWIFLRGKNTGI